MQVESFAEAIDVTADLLGRERDRGEGVLDLVGDTAGHFLPGGLLLGAEELRSIFEDEDIAEVGTGGGGTAFQQGDSGEEIHGGGGRVEGVAVAVGCGEAVAIRGGAEVDLS